MQMTTTMTTMTMGLLPQPKFNYRALMMSFALQIALLVVLIQTEIVQPVKLVKAAEKLVYIPLVTPVDTTPKWQPSVRGYVPPRG
jgi:hypothetical protein